MMRCAIYARYSSDMQRDTSIEDQVRRCEEFASRQGWTLTATFSDRAISGAAMVGRHQLQSMLQAVRKQPRPFDRVLVDDTSRLGRNVSEVLDIIERIKYRDAHLVAVTQGLDSSDASSRQLFTLNGMMDEQYIIGLGDKVHRGQEGRALKGFNPGGKCFGYRNVPIEDHARIGKYGRPMVQGVQLEIIEPEAAVTRRYPLRSNPAVIGLDGRNCEKRGMRKHLHAPEVIGSHRVKLSPRKPSAHQPKF